MTRRYWILTLMFLLSAFGLWTIGQLKFDSDMSTIKLAPDTDFESYKTLIKPFPTYEGGTIIIIENNRKWDDYGGF